MKRLLILLGVMLLALSIAACGGEQNTAEKGQTETMIKEEQKMRIRVEGNGKTIVYELNNSQAAKELYEQLPLTMEVENFSTNEKVFYPPQKLGIAGTPLAEGGKGTLAYYEPWGDVVMFYAPFEKGDSLYELGKAVSGENDIETLPGTAEITAVE